MKYWHKHTDHSDFYCPLYRHCDLQPGPPAQRRRQPPPPPPTASLSLHPPWAFPRRGHTLHRLAGVRLAGVLQSAGSGHELGPQPSVQSGDRDGPHPGVFGLGAGARRHLSGLLQALLWGVDAQQRQQPAERDMTHTHWCRDKQCWAIPRSLWRLLERLSGDSFKLL